MVRAQLMLAFFILLCAFSHVYGTFDQLQLVLRWPTSFCLDKKCERTPKNFTIHGLWPDSQGAVLNFCKKATYTTVKDQIFDKRDKNWPDLLLSKADGLDNQGFWERQYIKHGTCCLDLFNEEQFFDLSLVLKDKFDLVTTFRNHRIIPQSTHTLHKIEKTVKSVTRVRPNLSCTKNMELLEIGICFNRDASKMMDCHRPKTCSADGNKQIVFP